MEAISQALSAFFTQPGWLLPTAVSVGIQLVATHHIKAFVPHCWTDAKRDALIWLISCAIGVLVFVPTRWAWLCIDGQPFTAAHFVLSVAVALLVIAAMPFIYRKLPPEFRQHYSYEKKVSKRRKLVRDSEGRYHERPADQPSCPGEETIVSDVNRLHGD
jgi:uncharacterized membrane protein